MIRIKKCVAPVSYFPPIHYFAVWLLADTFFFEAHENYQKGSFRNRCVVVTSQGATTLSIPLLQGKNEQQPISEVLITDPKIWQKQHWATLQTAYGSAPYWEYYAPKIEKLIKSETDNFFSLAQQSCFLCADLLHPNLKKKSQNTTEFIFVDKNNTTSTNCFYFEPLMKLKALKQLDAPQYAQVFSDRNSFTPYASILDLLLCHGNRSLEILYQYAETFKSEK